MRLLLLASVVSALVESDEDEYRFEYGEDKVFRLHSNSSFYVSSEHGDDRVWINCTHGSLAQNNCKFEVNENGYVWVNATSQSVGVDYLTDQERLKILYGSKSLKCISFNPSGH